MCNFDLNETKNLQGCYIPLFFLDLNHFNQITFKTSDLLKLLAFTKTLLKLYKFYIHTHTSFKLNNNSTPFTDKSLLIM